MWDEEDSTLVKQNGTAAFESSLSQRFQSVHAAFESQVDRSSSETALIIPDLTGEDATEVGRSPPHLAPHGGCCVQVSFGELEAMANQIRCLAEKRGVGRGSLVGICMQRCPSRSPSAPCKM